MEARIHPSRHSGATGALAQEVLDEARRDSEVHAGIQFLMFRLCRLRDQNEHGVAMRVQEVLNELPKAVLSVHGAGKPKPVSNSRISAISAKGGYYE